VLLPNLLKRAGYHTAIAGKWHLGLEPPNTPLDRGFDHFHGFLGDMMDDYYRHTRHGNNYMRRQRQVIQPKGHATDLFSDWAIDYIKGRVGKEQPFFIYLAYNAPHTPIQPPDAWLERVKQREDNMTPSRAKLVALIEHLDEGIGRVVQSLADNGFKKNTLIVFVSDNGGQRDVGGNNGALRGTKGGMYEGGIRVPMCAVWPSKIPAGASLNTVGITMDLLPTLCEAAGVESVSNIDGRSLLRLLRGERLALRARDLFWVRREGGNRYMGQTIWAMRRGPWKLLQDTPNEPFRLYNLVDDPMEENDLAGSNKDKFKELGAGLRQHVQRSGAVPWQKSGGD
jgi:arylsulfatase A-like enzyme